MNSKFISMYTILFTIISSALLFINSFAQAEHNKYFKHHTIANPIPGPQE